MPILIVEIVKENETLYGVEVQGEVRVTYSTLAEAEAFAAEIVRGEA